MKDEKLNKGIEDIKNIQMTALEKERIFEHVINSSLKAHIKSPWSFNIFMNLRKTSLVYYVVIPLVIIFSTSSIVFASEGSLPGDIFYPIKVKVLEPINSSLKFSKVAKAEYASSLATTRLVEAETLVKQGKFDKPKEKQLNDLLSNHIANFNKDIDNLEQQSDDKSDNIVVNFQAQMNAHARVLDVIHNQDNDNSKVLDNTDSNIIQTARDNASKIKNSIRNRQDDNSDTYTKKKKVIQDIINSTDTSLNQNNDTTDKEDTVNNRRHNIKRKFIDNTHQTLDQARQLLQDANDKENQGDYKGAYQKLLDSESSAKESDIFLRTGLNFRGRNSDRGQDTNDN